MKRGLKVFVIRQIRFLYPLVTTYSPMKRGLKESIGGRIECLSRSYNLFPDEKGTESQVGVVSGVGRGCYNLFPDEKGTESAQCPVLDRCLRCVTTYSPMKRGLKGVQPNPYRAVILCYNLFPDEKGTERTKTLR